MVSFSIDGYNEFVKELLPSSSSFTSPTFSTYGIILSIERLEIGESACVKVGFLNRLLWKSSQWIYYPVPGFTKGVSIKK